MIRNRFLLVASALLLGLVASAQVHRMDIDLKKVGAPIQPTMYGIFFEDINYAADGGLYQLRGRRRPVRRAREKPFLRVPERPAPGLESLR